MFHLRALSRQVRATMTAMYGIRLATGGGATKTTARNYGTQTQGADHILKSCTRGVRLAVRYFCAVREDGANSLLVWPSGRPCFASWAGPERPMRPVWEGRGVAHTRTHLRRRLMRSSAISWFPDLLMLSVYPPHHLAAAQRIGSTRISALRSRQAELKLRASPLQDHGKPSSSREKWTAACSIVANRPW